MVVPGTMEGAFRVLYRFEDESLSEIRNGTVHAFLCFAFQAHEAGYRVYWAIYVKPVSRLTPIYMAAIDPFRRMVIYPAIIRRLERAWREAYG